MTDKEFADMVATGTLTKNDILKYAASVSDKVHLCWKLFCRRPDTGTPQAETECERLSTAMAWIEKEYNFDWWGEYLDEHPSKPTDFDIADLMELQSIEEAHMIAQTEQEQAERKRKEEFDEAVKDGIAEALAQADAEAAFADYLKPTESSTSREQHESSLQTNDKPLTLLSDLDTELAQEIFKKAIRAGLMEVQGNTFHWKKSNVLLSYMCGRIYCGDAAFETKFGTGKKTWKRGSTLFPDSKLNALFGKKNLGQSRLQAQYVPNGYELVDKLFD